MSAITEMPRGERTAKILMLLIRNKRRKYSVADIYKYLNEEEPVILRNVQRDCKVLSEIFPNEIGVERQQGRLFYFVHPDMRRSLSAPIERNGLLAFFLLKRLQPFFAPKAKPLESLAEALLDITAASAGDLFDDLDQTLEEAAFLFAPRSSLAIDGGMFNDLLTSLVKHRKLSILYAGGSYEEPKEKVVCPAKLILFKGELYFICTSEYNEKRDFYIKLCRILKAQVTEETFALDPKRVQRIEKRLVSSFGLLDESNPKPRKVVIRFPANPYYERIFAEKRYHHSQTVSTDKRGHVVVTMEVPVGMDLINWVLSWPEADVVGPEELKEELRSVARTLTKKYGK